MLIHQLSIKEIVAAIAEMKLSALEVCDHFVDRLERINPDLNAICEENFEAARAQAKMYTENFNAYDKSKHPLLGLPFTLKEMLAYRGKRRTGGNIHYRNDISVTTASAAARLENAGGILLATSNVPELGFWFETFNKIYGITNNPFDLQRTPGGSSGGEAALIGAGLSPLGLGSDIGGSLRLPAFFCGIAAHAPTRGLVPMTGHFPHQNQNLKHYPETQRPLAVVGPLAKRASDLHLIMKIISGPDDLDPVCNLNYPGPGPGTGTGPGRGAEYGHGTGTIAKSESKIDPRQLRVLTLADPAIHLATRTSHEISAEVTSVAQLLQSQGAQVEELPQKIFVDAVALWMELLNANKSSSFAENMMQMEDMNPRKMRTLLLKNLALLPLKMNHYTLPALATALLETITSAEHEAPDSGAASSKQTECLLELQRLKIKMRDLLGNNGILLLPTHPRTAPPHFKSLLYPFDFIYSGIMIALQLPATQLPTRLNEAGLPLGVQVVANYHRDDLAISAAAYLETFFPPFWPN